jgi:hypothetical protein
LGFCHGLRNDLLQKTPQFSDIPLVCAQREEAAANRVIAIEDKLLEKGAVPVDDTAGLVKHQQRLRRFREKQMNTTIQIPPQQGAPAVPQMDVSALYQLLSGLAQMNNTVEGLRLPQTGDLGTTPIMSPIDKALGGQAMLGLKTPLAIDEIAHRFPETASYCADYTHDDIPWCGLTIAYCMAHNGIRPVFGATDTDKFLWAQAWKQFGKSVDQPQLGDAEPVVVALSPVAVRRSLAIQLTHGGERGVSGWLNIPRVLSSSAHGRSIGCGNSPETARGRRLTKCLELKSKAASTSVTGMEQRTNCVHNGLALQ